MLELTSVNKVYGTGKVQFQALTNINVSLNSGEMVALCGPSGSGKSTLLNICGLLDLDYQGEVRLAGEQLKKQRHRAMQLRRKLLGFVFQKFNLVPVMSAFENIEYPLLLNKVHGSQRKIRVTAMLEAVGLAELADKRPDQLSGGQQQRVAIARALINKPLLVIADEPTASLDSVTAHQVIELMQTLGQDQQTTFLVASHDDRMTQHCQRTIQLCDGRLQESRMAGVNQTESIAPNATANLEVQPCSA